MWTHLTTSTHGKIPFSDYLSPNSYTAEVKIFNDTNNSNYFKSDSESEISYNSNFIGYYDNYIHSKKDFLNIIEKYYSNDYIEDELQEKREEEIAQWLEKYYEKLSKLVVVMTSEVDQTILSDVLLDLFKNNNFVTKRSRKKLAFKLLNSEKSKVRYASISGLFYLSDESDLDKIIQSSHHEELDSLKFMYKHLIKKLS